MEKLLLLINNLLDSIGVDKIDKLNPSLRLKEDLEIDSISYAELVVLIEDELGIDINENGISETIEDILKLVEKNKV